MLAFSGTIAPTRLSPTYRFGLVVVSLAMLLLPVIYVALITLAAAAVVWHLATNTWILRTSGLHWRLLVYATPAVAGSVLVFFMIKPILARRATTRDPLPVDPATEPVLFDFIDKICRQVRAPFPRRVQVDCAVNASAGFVPGPLSLLKNDLVLTIGLPLVAGLSIRELGGVLAHEFGHFAQGGGMRLTAIVRGVNSWFARVVYERDAWDEKLERWSNESDWRLRAVLHVARGAVWLSRRILTGLMVGGHAISCFMLRQMEYDADSYEIKIAGTDAFIRTSSQLRQLNLAAQFAYSDLSAGIGRGALPGDLAALVVARAHHIPEEWLATALGGREEKTGVFDTHPSDADRCRVARSAAAAGVLLGADAPATQLFRDFDAVSASATRHHFEHDLGLSVGAFALIDTGETIRASRQREANFAALDRLLGQRHSASRPLHIPLSTFATLTEDALRASVSSARDAMATADGGLSDEYTVWDALALQRQQAFAALELLSGGFSAVKPADFDLTDGTSAGAAAALEQALERQRSAAPVLEAFETCAVRRLACALLLHSKLRDGGVDATYLESLVNALNALTAVMADTNELHRLHIAASLLELNREASPNRDQTTARLRLLEARIAATRVRIRDVLVSVACPPEFSAAPIGLAERCGIPTEEASADPSEIADRVVRLYYEVLARLAALAVEAEAEAEGGDVHQSADVTGSPVPPVGD